MSSHHSDDEMAASDRPESPDQEQEQEYAEEQEEEQDEEEMPRDSPRIPDDDPSTIRDDEPRGNPLTARRVKLKSKTARRATYQSAVSPGPDIEDDYAELQQSSPARRENINTDPDGGFINPDSARKKERRMKWNDKKDRELLLFGLGRDIAGKEYQAIADSFPEKPTAKAVQERLTKLRALTRKVLKKTGIYDWEAARPPPNAPRRPSAPHTAAQPPAATPKQPRPKRKPRPSKTPKPAESSPNAGEPTPRPSSQPQQTPQPPNILQTPQAAASNITQTPQPASSVFQTPQQAAQPVPQPLPSHLSAAFQPSMGMQGMQSSYPIGSPQLGNLQLNFGTPAQSASQLAEYRRVAPFGSHLQYPQYQQQQQFGPIYPGAGNAYTPFGYQPLPQAQQYNYVPQQFPDPLALPGQAPFTFPREFGQAEATPRPSGPEMGGIIEEIPSEEIERAEEDLRALRAAKGPFR